MKIRIHETDFEGHPVDCTGDFFAGRTALEIVAAMQLDPFNGSLTPLEFMRQTLDGIGQKKFALPDDPERAAIEFLQRLTILGFAVFVLDDGELDVSHPLPPSKLPKKP